VLEETDTLDKKVPHHRRDGSADQGKVMEALEGIENDDIQFAGAYHDSRVNDARSHLMAHLDD